MGERRTRTAEARGSIPRRSTGVWPTSVELNAWQLTCPSMLRVDWPGWETTPWVLSSSGRALDLAKMSDRAKGLYGLQIC